VFLLHENGGIRSSHVKHAIVTFHPVIVQ